MKIRAVLITTLAVIASGTGLLFFLERTRTVEGTWLYMFEGSDFFEGQTPEKPCSLYMRNAAWLEYSPDRVYKQYRKVEPSLGSYRSPDGQWRMDAFSVKFWGRQKFALFGTGHFGMWNSSFEVDKMISVEPIPNIRCYVR